MPSSIHKFLLWISFTSMRMYLRSSESRVISLSGLRDDRLSVVRPSWLTWTRRTKNVVTLDIWINTSNIHRVANFLFLEVRLKSQTVVISGTKFLTHHCSSILRSMCIASSMWCVFQILTSCMAPSMFFPVSYPLGCPRLPVSFHTRHWLGR